MPILVGSINYYEYYLIEASVIKELESAFNASAVGAHKAY